MILVQSRRVWACLCAGLLAGVAHAGGFALGGQSASALGNAYAGQAAQADDATTLFFNPAGLMRLTGAQVVLSADVTHRSIRFDNAGSTAEPGQVVGGHGGDAGTDAMQPGFYLVIPLGHDTSFGLGVHSPFGLSSEYDADWAGRFQAITSELKTLNINPALAIRLNDTWSVGFGLNAQQARALLTKMINYHATVANAEGMMRVQGDDWAWGYHLGVLFEPYADTRIGLAYRSGVRHQLEGHATYADRPLPAADGAASINLTLPASASLSVVKVLSPRWDVLADATWTEWRKFQGFDIQTPAGTDSSMTGWKNAWRVSLGANYYPSEHLTWRFGVAFDDSPVPEARRTPHVVDADSLWLATGVQYRFDKQRWLDVGYAHVLVDSLRIQAAGPGVSVLAGDYGNSMDMLSLQYTHHFN